MNSVPASQFEVQETTKQSSNSRSSSIFSEWGICLLAWFCFNVAITLYSKAVFSTYRFPYPILMTCIHTIFTGLGVCMCWICGWYTPKGFNLQAISSLLWFSFVFTANIWLSNASLMAVSVNLHQVIRTTIPLFTMAISIAVYCEAYPLRLLPSVLLVIAGVAATVWGDLSFGIGGLGLVMSGCFLSSLKGLMTQKTQIGSLGLSSLDMLLYVSPFAAIELFLMAFALGEFPRVLEDENIKKVTIIHLCVVGIIAFGLNVVSFRSAALLNPVTLNIAGNVKQVLTSMLSVWMFNGFFFGITSVRSRDHVFRSFLVFDGDETMANSKGTPSCS